MYKSDISIRFRFGDIHSRGANNALRAGGGANKFFLEKDETTDILSLSSAINLGSFFGLFYAVEVVQAETSKNTIVHPPAHTRACSNMYYILLTN